MAIGGPQPFAAAGDNKNFPLSPAASDLGLGDSLVQQMQDADEERKSKLAMQAKTVQTAQAQAAALTPGVSQLMLGKIG